MKHEHRSVATARDARDVEPARFDTDSAAAAAALASDLRAAVEGEVRFDTGSRALYATDASNYRQVPIGVVVPLHVDDVVKTIAVARRHGAPVLARGGGTSLAGQCCNVAVVLDFSKHVHEVVRIDPERRLGTVRPGCVLDDLREAAGIHGLTFGPDPATHRHCTLGGMLGNNSCGIHSLLAANHGFGLRTSDNTHELEVLTYDGERMRVGPTTPEELEAIIRGGGRRGDIYARMKALRDKYADRIRARFPRLPRRVSGYNLDELLPENGFDVARLLVGSEGTLVTVLEATLHLVPAPESRALLVLGYPDVVAAGNQVPEILTLEPIGLEGLDHLLIEYIRRKGGETGDLALLPDGKAFLLVEFGGATREDSEEQARRCMALLRRSKRPPAMKLFDDPREEQKLWHVRESGLGATAFVPGLPDMWPGWEDSAVPPDRVGPYLLDLRELFEKYEYQPSVYGHFGQGCIHCRIDFDLVSDAGIRRWRAFMDEAAGLVVQHGGSLSGEHGDGQARGELLPRMFGAEIVEAFRELKQIFDPNDRMNPGKVVDPAPITSDLRLGAGYDPPEPRTHFSFRDDQGRFSRAALRCVGVGKCRDRAGHVMCPSFQATHEEMHSTRGRARLLWEMLDGRVVEDGWRSESVREALDLCLACKGCKSDCPVSVDMATYKAEFLSHYYAGRLRPRQAYSMGWIDRWARLAAIAPRLVNAIAHAPVVRDVAKRLGGIAPERDVPRFAPETFQRWFRRRASTTTATSSSPRPSVVLWADTFTNHFHPDVGQAAVEVLEAAGFDVRVPPQSLCCGRPLYDFGMLDRARKLLLEILDALRPAIESGLPVVVLEPSCAAVFRDELVELVPDHPIAERLRDQTLLLGEFLAQRANDFHPPTLGRKAIVHGHCHQKALIGMDAETDLLDRLDVRADEPEPGCCGMAGSFGFERGRRYEVSRTCGERALLPAVRAARGDTLVVADGFSCREQIAQGTGRRALHLAQVIQLALHHGRSESGTSPRREREGAGRPS